MRSYRITEHDAFEHDVLQSLDLDTPDPEHDQHVEHIFARLTMTDETVMAALLTSPWATAAAVGYEIKIGGRL
jgi:hypothetical protein